MLWEYFKIAVEFLFWWTVVGVVLGFAVAYVWPTDEDWRRVSERNRYSVF